MGFRFYKSVKLLPGIRLNISKSGLSTSLGGPGATVNFGPRGVRQTLGLPGTGLSYVTTEGYGGSDGTSGFNPGCLVLLVLGLFALAVSQCDGSGDAPSYTPPSSTVSTPGNSLMTPAAPFAEGSTVFVTAGSLNARAGPSTSSPIVGGLRQGQAVRVVEAQGDWLKVAQGAALFWIASSFVSSDRPVQPLMTMPPTSRGQSGNPSRRRSGYSGGGCPCSGRQVCIGPRGGRYCITSGGNKRYGV